ncbi:helix-turn-helix domain-containing protein [Janthinobacterium sp.]|uniref:helix-turn-helix domain-containing protein n=1 Tax=Janthinobacterium sp. TaxID=1871054 RepID=UPI00293D480C|nr:helix-turn-helix domain-containing protein [Janthinobacterium sp.]
MSAHTLFVAPLIRAPAYAGADCANCPSRQSCLPQGLDEAGAGRLAAIIPERRRVLRGASLYRTGDSLRNVYAVRLGHFKTERIDFSGTRRVTGFHASGDLLGTDAIGADQHTCSAEALEDSEVCVIPFQPLQELFGAEPALRRRFHRIMSGAIIRDQISMSLLGTMPAEQRLAAFFVNQSAFYEARGYSPNSFQLRMTREDIASYLGLAIESVSRMLLRLKNKAWLEVERRSVVIVEMAMLKALARGERAAPMAGADAPHWSPLSEAAAARAAPPAFDVPAAARLRWSGATPAATPSRRA